MKKVGARDIQALHAGAIKALKRAVTKAIAQHKLAGVPAVIWQDGRVVRLASRPVKRRRH